MTKNKKWWKDADIWYGNFEQMPELSEIVVERTIKSAAEGNDGDYEELFDAAQEGARWISALLAVDQRSDPRQLLKLLQPLVPPPIFPHLADLLDRKFVPHGKGRPRTPSYLRQIDGPEVVLHFGLAHVKYLMTERGMSLADALAKVAHMQNIPLDLLTNAQAQRRGSSRRAKKSSAHN